MTSAMFFVAGGLVGQLLVAGWWFLFRSLDRRNQ